MLFVRKPLRSSPCVQSVRPIAFIRRGSGQLRLVAAATLSLFLAPAATSAIAVEGSVIHVFGVELPLGPKGDIRPANSPWSACRRAALPGSARAHLGPAGARAPRLPSLPCLRPAPARDHGRCRWHSRQAAAVVAQHCHVRPFAALVVVDRSSERADALPNRAGRQVAAGLQSFDPLLDPPIGQVSQRNIADLRDQPGDQHLIGPRRLSGVREATQH